MKIKKLTEELEELEKYEVYDINDDKLMSFDDMDDAMNFAIKHNAEFINYVNGDYIEKVWENNGEDYEKCWFCGDWFEKPEMLKTDDGYLCKDCFDALRSHGEPVKVMYGYDDDMSDYYD